MQNRLWTMSIGNDNTGNYRVLSTHQLVRNKLIDSQMGIKHSQYSFFHNALR